MSHLTDLFNAFSATDSHEEKVAIYEQIKKEQIRQEQSALAVLYGEGK